MLSRSLKNSASQLKSDPCNCYGMLQGPYIVTMNASDSGGKQLLCLEIDFDVKPPDFPGSQQGSPLSRAKSLLRGVARA